MRHSEFRRLMRDEFGDAYGGMVASSHSLAALGERSAAEAIRDGVPPRQVWDAICDAFDVPPQRRLGRDLPIIDREV